MVWAEVTDAYKPPSPSAVWDSLAEMWLQGTLFGVMWTSVSRALLGFVLALAIGTPLGLLVAPGQARPGGHRPDPLRPAVPPSVAWVPPAVLWLGLNDRMMFAVILLGAVPSIANGLVAGVDQVPPLFLRAGRTLGATGLRGAWHVVMPAALPGYLAGLKQGWAFSWRSLMAAEIIASSRTSASASASCWTTAATTPTCPASSWRSCSSCSSVSPSTCWSSARWNAGCCAAAGPAGQELTP